MDSIIVLIDTLLGRGGPCHRLIRLVHFATDPIRQCLVQPLIETVRESRIYGSEAVINVRSLQVVSEFIGSQTAVLIGEQCLNLMLPLNGVNKFNELRGILISRGEYKGVPSKMIFEQV